MKPRTLLEKLKAASDLHSGRTGPKPKVSDEKLLDTYIASGGSLAATARRLGLWPGSVGTRVRRLIATVERK